ncbi:MAG: hypothetical protein GOU99_03370, partial [Candidatus Altiarchaeota archaeon]|nr:hypothetical protein [Candidatus Altiarchaeota archaeon]
MRISIKQDNKNKLLGRREVAFEVHHKKLATPSKNELAEILAAKLNVKLDLMVIRHYRTQFGKHLANGICLIYESTEKMTAAESRKHINEKKRIGIKPVKKPAKPVEAPAEKQEEKPAEAEKTEPAKE